MSFSNARGRVFVEMQDGKPIRILQKKQAWRVENKQEMPRKDAVAEIRKQVFERSRGECENCSYPITANAHMDEKISRGDGGEISLTNCQMLCARCHIIGPTSKHGNRTPQWTGQALVRPPKT